MKRYLCLLLFVIGLSPAVLFPGNITLKKLGEWGSGDYTHVALKGEYAYCTASRGGLDIIDISNPAAPVKVGNCETPGNARRVDVRKDYAYVADYEGGLQIINISDPSKPFSTLPEDFVQFGEDVKDVCVRRDYAYIADSSRGLLIIDVSNPSAPVLKGKYDTYMHASMVFEREGYAYVGYLDMIRVIDVSNPAVPIMVGYYDMSGSYYYLENIYVNVNAKYAYISCANVNTKFYFGSLVILDVSNPLLPVFVGDCPTAASSSKYVTVNGDYAYLANGVDGGDIVDVSNPASPTKTGSFGTPGIAYGAAADGNYLYIADGHKGLRVIDVSTPSSPAFKGIYNASGSIKGVFINGNYAYITKGFDSFKIIDISKPASPTAVGDYEMPSKPNRLFVKGQYAYVACGGPWLDQQTDAGSILVLDISDPASPSLAASIDTGGYASDVYVKGNYMYAAGYGNGFQVIDISDLSSPKIISEFGDYGSVYNIHVQGDHAYALGTDFYLDNILMVFDISNPASLPSPGYLYEGDYTNFNTLYDVFAKGNYAYVAAHSGLHIIDISNPASPSPSGLFKDIEATSVFVEGDHAFTATNDLGVSVINVSNPTLPYLEGQYNEPGDGSDVFAKAPYVYLGAGASGKLVILKQSLSIQSPQIILDRTDMLFNVSSNGIASAPQSFVVDNAGGGTLNWSVSGDTDWIHFSPASGSGSGEVTVSVDPAGLSCNSYYAAVTVSDPNAWNSPQTIAVTLTVYRQGVGVSFDPFGQFDTPLDGSIVRGSVPVTGWALDDIGVQSVQIFREEGKSLAYIGDAVFVEGARPDVALMYNYYPNSYNAGWGYMMLTNFLPNGGNGTFTIHAIATDLEGNQVTLGTSTITCDNANAVKPFGAIDTPKQGGSASGSQFANYGWALTPLPNTIPIDGSTIVVWVDGVLIGNPNYNYYRQDIANLFPGYNNSNGAVGYFNLDTTKFTNGVHIIHWTVTDNAGNAEGIGSRYFRILNTAADSTLGTVMTSPPKDFTVDTIESVGIIRGYQKDAEPTNLYPDDNGNIITEIRELERVEIHLPFTSLLTDHPGCLVVGERSMPLPVGSTVDVTQSVFSWQTGPGYVGKYHLRFFGKDPNGDITAKDAIVQINPKFSN